MEVAVTFKLTPQEAIELVQGTNDALQKSVLDSLSKTMVETTAKVYKEAAPSSYGDILNPLEWWRSKSKDGS